jgi:hypothetical protein
MHQTSGGMPLVALFVVLERFVDQNQYLNKCGASNGSE